MVVLLFKQVFIYILLFVFFPLSSFHLMSYEDHKYFILISYDILNGCYNIL